MQHVFGKPHNRSSIWRWGKAQERYELSPGRKKRGRGYSHDNMTKSFVLFTGAVIQNVNETGHCDYAAIRQQGSYCGFGFHYREVPAELYQRLASSGFPPAMMGVAVCDLVPLNLVIPRKPSSASKLFLHQKTKVEMKKAGMSCSVENFPAAERRERLKAVLREADYPPHVIRSYLAEAEKVEYKADWVQAYLREYKSPTDKKFTGKAPLPMSSRGTRAHQVEYTGAEISRRMACYWRKHRRFQDCKEFIRSLFVKPIPKTPFANGLTMLDWEVNSAFQEHMRLVRMSKMLNEPRTNDDPPMPVCEKCGEKFDGDPEDKLCPDCREQNAPDEDDEDSDDADLGLGIL
jgi:rubrerythrin